MAKQIEIGDKIKSRFGDIGTVICITRLDQLEDCNLEDEGDLPYLICQTIEGRQFEVCEYEADLVEP